MIYVTGNIHADIERLTELKIKKGDILICCGDFGFIWDGSNAERKVLDQLKKLHFNIFFVDGTHENFNLLKSYPTTELLGGKAQRIIDNVYRLLRGQIYKVEDKKIFAFGGGLSEDKEYRVSSKTWWQEELPTEEEIQEAKKNLEQNNFCVDFICTHEPPAYIKSLIENSLQNLTPVNSFFDKISNLVSYEKWFFGYNHVDKFYTKNHRAVFLDIISVSKSNNKKGGKRKKRS